MKYAHADRLEAVRHALQHNLSVLRAFFDRAGIETVEVPFRASGGNVLFGDETLTGRADMPVGVLKEMIDGLQDVRPAGAGVERVAMLPLALDAALRDACAYAADLRADDWKNSAEGAVKFWGDGVCEVELEVPRPTKLGGVNTPRPAPRAPGGGRRPSGARTVMTPERRQEDERDPVQAARARVAATNAAVLLRGMRDAGVGYLCVRFKSESDRGDAELDALSDAVPVEAMLTGLLARGLQGHLRTRPPAPMELAVRQVALDILDAEHPDWKYAELGAAGRVEFRPDGVVVAFSETVRDVRWSLSEFTPTEATMEGDGNEFERRDPDPPRPYLQQDDPDGPEP